MISKKVFSFLVGAGFAFILAAVAPGCGADAPPPEPSTADLESAKQQQEDIMARERASVGGSAKKAKSKN